MTSTVIARAVWTVAILLLAFFEAFGVSRGDWLIFAILYSLQTTVFAGLHRVEAAVRNSRND